MNLLVDQSPGSIYDLISKGGVPGLLIFILWSGYKGWWIWKPQFDELKERLDTVRREKNEWKEIALRSTNLAETLDEMRRNQR